MSIIRAQTKLILSLQAHTRYIRSSSALLHYSKCRSLRAALKFIGIAARLHVTVCIAARRHKYTCTCTCTCTLTTFWCFAYLPLLLSLCMPSSALNLLLREQWALSSRHVFTGALAPDPSSNSNTPPPRVPMRTRRPALCTLVAAVLSAGISF